MVLQKYRSMQDIIIDQVSPGWYHGTQTIPKVPPQTN